MARGPRTSPLRRLASVGPNLVDSFLRDNKVIPPVLAVLALLVFSWIVAGAFIGTPEREQVSNQSVVGQAEDPPSGGSGEDGGGGDDPGTGTPAPDAENRDADSYAAYQSKDPFRQLLTPADAAEGTTEGTTPEGTEGTTPDDGTGDGTGDDTGDGTDDGTGGNDNGGNNNGGGDGGNGDDAGNGGDNNNGGGTGGNGNNNGGRGGGGGGLFDSGGNLN